MAEITYIEPDGNSRKVYVENGQSLMQGAINNDINGIEAECGGACVCATCHIRVDEAWFSKIPPAEEVEQLTLEETENPTIHSRLACQIQVNDSLDGLVIHVQDSSF
ncbi:2Fe-2S iron-sulfur cluster-binding protein [Photobacterium makurazakiensis]|uniref:2Fe-2S iron-sulfur cluster-binding protein n=1 Tax=Photobacterium TaxID=657 RepID=UPI003D13E518